MKVLHPYRRVLEAPGVRTLLVVGLLGRIPVLTVGLTLTLHVVGVMKLGFLEAGLAGAAWTGGVAVGAPIKGHFLDRYGLRPVVAITAAAQLVFWPVAAFLSYWPLVGGAFAAGMLALPVFTLMRQCLAVVVPAEGRRTAFALDSALSQVSFMIGPAIAVAAVGVVGSRWAMVLVGGGLVAAGVALLVVNPPTRAGEKAGTAKVAVPLRQWANSPLLALLGITFAGSFVGTAIELGLVAAFKAGGATQWIGLAIAVLSLSALVSGLAYGALPRGFSPVVLVGATSVLTLPIGLFGPWQLLWAATVPAAMLGTPAYSAAVHALTRRTPEAARGAAMGLHHTFSTSGAAVAGPVAGSVIDGWGTGWSFAVTGLAGLLVVMLAVPLWRRAPRPAEPVADTAEQPRAA